MAFRYPLRLLSLLILRREEFHDAPGRSPRPERAIYNEAVITAPTVIWEAADRICGKRLKAVLTTFVESMEHHGHLSWIGRCGNGYSE